jgi:hypothetical protein
MRDADRSIPALGLITGMIGYGATIVVTAAIDVAGGRSIFFTPALFGGTLFYDLADSAHPVLAPGPVLAYNMLHLVVFLALGFGAAWLTELAERHPTAQYLVLVFLVMIGFHVYAGLVFFAQPLLGNASWWRLGLGSLVAAVAMGWYLLREHPLLRSELKELPMGDAS